MGRLSDAMLQSELFEPPKKTIAPQSPPSQSDDLDGIDDVPFEVREEFERLTLQVAARGIKRYSSDAILHQLRWHHHIEKGNREFKCNDNWTAPLARWFMQRHPHLSDFFETRVRKSLTTGDDQ